MRNILLLAFLGGVLMACGGSPPTHMQTFEIICPLNMTATVYDTVRAHRVYHNDGLLFVSNGALTWPKTYPGTCVVRQLQGD